MHGPYVLGLRSPCFHSFGGQLVIARGRGLLQGEVEPAEQAVSLVVARPEGLGYVGQHQPAAKRSRCAATAERHVDHRRGTPASAAPMTVGRVPSAIGRRGGDEDVEHPAGRGGQHARAGTISRAATKMA